MMKKVKKTNIVSVALFFSLLSLSIRATAQDFLIGLYFQPSVSWMTADDNLINSNGAVLGMRFGGVGENFFSSSISLESTFGFAFGEGGKLLHENPGNYWPNSDLGDDQLNDNQTAFPARSSLAYRMAMLQISTAPKLYIGNSTGSRWWLKAPIVQIAINNRTRGSVSSPTLQLEDISIDKDVNTFHLAWGLGIGKRINLADDNQLDIGANWMTGFTDITEDEGVKEINGQLSGENSKGILNSINFGVTLIF